MCGPTQNEKDMSDAQTAMYKQMSDEYQTQFGENQNLVSALTSTFQPIFQAGPSQEGYSAGEKETLDTQATEGTAADYAKAQTATSEQLAARGGGNAFIPSGQDAQILAGNNNAAAAQEATQKSNILSADYNQGYQNWLTAGTGLGEASTVLSGTAGLAGAVNNAGTVANASNKTVSDASMSPYSALAGVVGSVAGNLTYSSGKGFGLGG